MLYRVVKPLIDLNVNQMKFYIKFITNNNKTSIAISITKSLLCKQKKKDLLQYDSLSKNPNNFYEMS